MPGLVAFIGRQAGAIELRPDHKLIYQRQCGDPPARLRGVRGLFDDLAEVVAAEHLEFKQFQGNSVRVSGWPDEPTEQKKAEWVATYSDHALLYFVVQKV